MSRLYADDDPFSAYQAAMMHRAGGYSQRFDEYYRCYPIVMMPGPDKMAENHGGKVFLPASALEKLSRLRIAYPMLFELINGAKDKISHAGVLEFTAEEGKIYLPYWLMQTLLLEAGDLLQIKSTDLPPGKFIKLQPQSPAFLDISDPKAVLEVAFKNFFCMTVGDIFTFAYNDNVYEVAVLEVKPELGQQAICTLETDLEVDFDEPVGYQDWLKAQTAAAPKAKNALAGGKIHTQGTMAQAINYEAIAPKTTTAIDQATSRFSGGGHRVGNKKSKPPSGTATPPIIGTHDIPRPRAGPQPLRLPPGKLFFGYEYIPLKKKGESQEQDKSTTHFEGRGQSLRGKVIESGSATINEPKSDSKDDKKSEGRTLRDTKKTG